MTQFALLGAISALGKLTIALVAVSAARLGAFDFAAWAIVLTALPSWFEASHRASGHSEGRSDRWLRVSAESVSFGVAPTFVVHEAYAWTEPWGVVIATAYAVAATVAVARSRVEPGPLGDPTTPGLPAAAAAVLLTTAYPFFGAPPVAAALGGPLDPQEIGGVMICLLILMLSPVPYPVVLLKKPGRSHGRIFAAGLAVLAFPTYVAFPAAVAYTFWGMAGSVTPIITDGVLHGGLEEGRMAKGNRGEDAPDDDGRYRARSTWE